MHNKKLLAILEAFKTWHHYLKACKLKIFVFNDNNNLCQFINMKSHSSYHISVANELSYYFFKTDYCLKNVNAMANILFHFFQTSQVKE